MSYNYDSNPWDDNYNQGAQSGAGPAGYTAGAGFGTPDGYGQQAQYSGDYNSTTQGSAGHYDYSNEQQMQQDTGQQQQQQLPESSAKPERCESAVKRFLRAHVPLCGPLMDCTSSLCGPLLDPVLRLINRDLLVSKIFYFFFYSAFGSLFPLMGVYFKQLGMNPAQVGILTGVRPFIEIFSAPFWNSLAERFQKTKALLLFSLVSWIVFTYSLAHIRPPASACVAFNDTDYVLYTPYSDNDLSNYDIGQLDKGAGEPAAESAARRLPGGGRADELENKSEILASEENANDQGKRRRRRRKRQASTRSYAEQLGNRLVAEQIDRPSRARYVYSVDSATANHNENNLDEGYESHLDLDVDLENDFDDMVIQRPASSEHDADNDNDNNNDQASSHYRAGSTAFFEADDGEQQVGADHRPDYYNEMEQSFVGAAVHRLKRAAAGDADYTAGEPDESERQEQPAPQADREDNNDVGGGDDEAEPGGGGRKVKGRQPGGDEETDGEAGDYHESYNDNKKATNKQQQQAATTSASAVMTNSGDASRDEEENREVSSPPPATVNKTKRVYRQRHKTPPTHIVGMSPITVEYAVNYNKEKHSQFVTPMFSTIVYKLDDIKEVFFLLLLLISLGEFFSAPAITIADSITLSYLGDNTDLYGRQRMFGSVSWAITLLLVGMALDNSTTIADHPCGPHQRERSYTVCFAIFSLLMGCAFVTATQFRFDYPKSGGRTNNGGGNGGPNQAKMVTSTSANNDTVVTTTLDGQQATSNIDDLYASTQPRNIFNTAPPVNAPPPGSQKEKFEFLDKWKSAVFAQRTWELPEWVNVFRQFKDPLNLTYLFITWFLGCGVGLVFTFLFWHLQDVGGTPTLFGICSVINHISEILAYFFSSNVIKRFGHTKVLSVGLGCNVIRFLYVAFLSNPYYALPFELVQGITHAACFAACCSYMSHVSKPELRTSTQGVMQGLHHGIGRACGALIGGYMINAIGSRASFCIYGLLSGCVLAGFLHVRRRASSMIKDEEVKVDDNEALGGYGAPQGVPSAIPGKITQTVSPQDIDYQW